MRILLGISILVLVAILWTMISIVRHIRITRRRNLFLREQQDEQRLQMVPPLRPVANVTPLPARFAAPVFPAAPREPSAAELSYAELAAVAARAAVLEPSTNASLQVNDIVDSASVEPQATESQAAEIPIQVPYKVMPTAEPAGITSSRHAVAALEKASTVDPLGLIAAARKFSHDLPMPQIRPSETNRIVETPPEEHVLRILEFVPDSVNSDVSSATLAFPSLSTAQPSRAPRQMPMATAAASDPHVRRPVRSVQSPAAAFTLPKHRPDWAYFNKDMGDLSDPLPRRVRDRVRSR